jgi:beta-lactam-binding protein with PASTA domain
VGAVAQRSDPGAESDTVLETHPPAGTEVAAGSAVDLVVAVPTRPTCTVPQVGGLPRSEAEAAIQDADLTVGSESQEPSATAEQGSVLRTDPAAGSTVECDSTVSMVVSSGPPPVDDCRVPDVAGLTRAQAAAAIQDADLSVGSDVVRTDESPEGTVLGTDPPAGATVACDSTVALVVSSGPEQCTVPQVVGSTAQAAVAALREARLVKGEVTEGRDPSVEPDTVLSSTPAPGSTVDCGSAVALVVAVEPTCTVPDVEERQRDAAVAAIEDAGLVAAEQAEPSSEEAGTVLDQEPAPGSAVDCGSAVTLLVSSGPEQCAVPDVVGMTQADAEAAIGAADLTVGSATPTADSSPAGTVLGTVPASGSEVECGSAVTLLVSSGPAQSVDPEQQGSEQVDPGQDGPG